MIFHFQRISNTQNKEGKQGRVIKNSAIKRKYEKTMNMMQYQNINLLTVILARVAI